MTPNPMTSDLLAGVRVVSLAQQYPGPYCTMLLADLGADVILVEQPQGGDPARGPQGMSPFFAALNRNKRSVTLDLKAAEGVSRLWQLLGAADILVEGFRPGVMERLGFGRDVVRAKLPGLVYASISGYGQDGPDRLTPGHDLSYVARAGWLSDISSKLLPDYRLPVAVGDLSSAMFAAFSVAAALVRARTSGEGAYIDVSMTDGLASWLGTRLEPLLDQAEGASETVGPGVGGEPAYGIFRCGDDRFITLSIAYEDHFWRSLCDTLGFPEEKALSGPARRVAREELRERIGKRLATRPSVEWLVAFAHADVPAGPVSSHAEVMADPQFCSRGLFAQGPSEEGGQRRYVGNPLTIDGIRPAIRRPAPRLGEHSDEIWSEIDSG